jgi:hypothetical protein
MLLRWDKIKYFYLCVHCGILKKGGGLIMATKFKPRAIYRWKKGEEISSYPPYDKYDKEFNLLMATEYNDNIIGDCYVINKNGDVHPGYSASPIPVNIDHVIKIADSIKEL